MSCLSSYPFPTRVAKFVKASPLGIGLVESEDGVSLAKMYRRAARLCAAFDRSIVLLASPSGVKSSRPCHC